MEYKMFKYNELIIIFFYKKNILFINIHIVLNTPSSYNILVPVPVNNNFET